MKPKKIIIHHSLTKDSGTVSWGAIRKYHTETLGWNDIGYHCGIEWIENGPNMYYEALMGRAWHIPGAHTIGENYDSLGICFVGNYNEEEPEEEMLEVGANVIKLWMDIYDIPLYNIFGHRKFASYKTCPGRKFEISRLEKIIRG